jgi:hypothetical protein
MVTCQRVGAVSSGTTLLACYLVVAGRRNGAEPVFRCCALQTLCKCGDEEGGLKPVASRVAGLGQQVPVAVEGDLDAAGSV